MYPYLIWWYTYWCLISSRFSVLLLGPVLLTPVASDSSRNRAFVTPSILLTCRDAYARIAVAINIALPVKAVAKDRRKVKMAIANRFVAMYLANRHRQERVFRERAAHMAMSEEEFRANFRLSRAAAREVIDAYSESRYANRTRRSPALSPSQEMNMH